jgi:hypothetical protein
MTDIDVIMNQIMSDLQFNLSEELHRQTSARLYRTSISFRYMKDRLDFHKAQKRSRLKRSIQMSLIFNLHQKLCLI